MALIKPYARTNAVPIVGFRMDNTSAYLQSLATALAVRDSTATPWMMSCAEEPDRVQQAETTCTGGFSIRSATETIKDASDLNTSLSIDFVSTLSGNSLP